MDECGGRRREGGEGIDGGRGEGGEGGMHCAQ